MAAAAAENTELEEQVLAVCRQHEAGLSQDQLSTALPSIPVARIADCLNSLLVKAKIQLFGASATVGAPQTPVFKFVKPEEAVKCAAAAVRPSLPSRLPRPSLQVQGPQPRGAARLPAHPEHAEQG